MIVLAPDSRLYEQYIFPSVFNTDHKYTMCLHEDKPWSPRNYNILDVIKHLPNHKLLSARLIDTGFDYTVAATDTPVDQTLVVDVEAQFEIILQKGPFQTKYFSTIKVLVCPKCKQAHLTIDGRKEGQLVITCFNCGLRGDIELESLK